MVADIAVCTWFVADDAGEGTFFPQIGLSSDTQHAHAIYWRCVICFFASSLAVNREVKHILFTNTQVPYVDGIDLANLLDRWGVMVVQIPITYRLPKGVSASWGNQFYIFDILDHLKVNKLTEQTIILDSDCLWLRPVSERMHAAIKANGALTYFLDDEEHPEDEAINGVTRGQMAQFLRDHGGPHHASIPYFGGEIYAATQDTTERIASRAQALWPAVLAQSEGAPHEEAHFLSILYALEGFEAKTANPFIRRMWTTFHYNNLRESDPALTLWHLPAEKRSGFADMFRRIVAKPAADPAADTEALGLNVSSYAKTMGWPRRRPIKLVRDLGLKIAEKVRS